MLVLSFIYAFFSFFLILGSDEPGITFLGLALIYIVVAYLFKSTGRDTNDRA